MARFISLALLIVLGLWACDNDEKPTGPPHVVRYPEKERQFMLDGCKEPSLRAGLATEEQMDTYCECVIRWHEERVSFEDYLVEAERLNNGEINKLVTWALASGEACIGTISQ